MDEKNGKNLSKEVKEKLIKFKNDFSADLYPANIPFLTTAIALFVVLHFTVYDITFGFTGFLNTYVVSILYGDNILSHFLSAVIASLLIWYFTIQVLRQAIKLFLSYKGWMYENIHSGVISNTTKIWFYTLQSISKFGPSTYSYQGLLPNLPVPPLEDTMNRHLLSMRPVLNDEDYNELVELTDEFQTGIGVKLQRYLKIKALFSRNYISDWWEQYVYLKQRTPIMIDSNYYGFDVIKDHPTDKQAARAANVTYAAMMFREQIESEELSPFSISPKTRLPFCTSQYKRLFNAARIPGKEMDSLQKWNNIDFISVYSKGCWYKLVIHNGERLYEPAELQKAIQEIIDSGDKPKNGEEKIAVLTAGDRTHWANTRETYFSSGINKKSLDVIEQSAFTLILDDEEVSYDPNDSSKMDKWASSLLHGKGHDRWFDKSFSLIIYKNGKTGMNAEHSWGDGAITAHLSDFMIITDFVIKGYDKDGNCNGVPQSVVHVEKLEWDLDSGAVENIEVSMKVAQKMIDDVEMALLVWTDYGKGFMKKLKISPDAFVQACLQLTYYRNQQHFPLTYEASMTRMFRDGRTETVRSCSNESSDFVKGILDENKTPKERLKLLHKSAERHQQLYRDAMCGKGIDRHLFALYVVLKYLGEESPLFNKIMPPTYSLSTSQTPMSQCEEDVKRLKISAETREKLVTAGGGFGPVAEKGYGVSYILAGENQISFHISSKKSAENTSSAKFREDLKQSLKDMHALFS